MAEPRATTIRFSEPMYKRLEIAGQLTGLPINSIVVIACLEWLDAHQPEHRLFPLQPSPSMALAAGGRLTQRSWAPRVKRPGPPFERFTEQAKHVLGLAQEEAERSGQSYIGDEHLLLGLLLAEDGLAARALHSLGLDAEKMRAAARSVLAETAPAPVERAGLPTSHVKSIIDGAFKHAQEKGHPYVGTGDLLVALIEEPDTVALAVLNRLNVQAERARTEAERLGPESSG